MTNRRAASPLHSPSEAEVLACVLKLPKELAGDIFGISLRRALFGSLLPCCVFRAGALWILARAGSVLGSGTLADFATEP